MDRLLDEAAVVVFDAVGTLLLPEPAAADVYACVGARHGSRLPLELIHTRFRAAFRAEEETDRARGLQVSHDRERQRWQAIVGRVLDDVRDNQACFEDLWLHFAQPSSWRLIGTAAALFAELRRRGVKLAVASNFDARLRSVLAGFREFELFDAIAISSEVGWRKPAPAFFTELCRRLEVPPNAILFVGDDRANDYDGALQAGFRAVLLDPEGQHPHCSRIERLEDLLRRS